MDENVRNSLRLGPDFFRDTASALTRLGDACEHSARVFYLLNAHLGHPGRLPKSSRRVYKQYRWTSYGRKRRIHVQITR
jgi:hypothetical protein